MLDLDTTEDTSEFCSFLDAPSNRESIEESGTEGISASGRIDGVFRVDGRDRYESGFGVDIGSFFSSRDDRDGSVIETQIDEIRPGEFLEHLAFVFIHDGQIGTDGQVSELFSVEYEGHLSRIKNPEDIILLAFCHALLDPFLGIGSDDSVRVGMRSDRELSREIHRTRMECIDLSGCLVIHDEGLWTELFRIYFDSLGPDSELSESFDVFRGIFSDRRDDGRRCFEEGEIVGDIPRRSTIFLAHHRRDEREVEIFMGPRCDLLAEFTHSGYDDIKSNGTGDEYGHK